MEEGLKENNLETSEYNNEKLKEIRKKLTNLQESEYIEIFNIIRGDTDKYTINNYGVHVNMGKLSISTLNKLEEFIEFSAMNKAKLDEDNIQRNCMIKLINKKIDDISNYDMSESSLLNDESEYNTNINNDETIINL